MFPFDLPGPQFLLFYGIFALGVLAALHFGRLRRESGPLPAAAAPDPYVLACLRGGPKEVACVATLALIDRGLLDISGRTVHVRPAAQPEPKLRRIEREVLRHFDGGADLLSITKDPTALAVAAAEYEDALERAGLLPDAQLRRARRWSMAIALACLVGLGGAKLMVALTAGRSNIGFLILMMFAAGVAVLAIGNPYRTCAGDTYLASVRTMFSGLRRQVSTITPGNGSLELLWLTSLFGAAALPASAFPFAAYFTTKTSASVGIDLDGDGGGDGGGCGGGCGGCGG